MKAIPVHRYKLKDMAVFSILVFILWFESFKLVNGVDISEMDRLMNDKLSNYNKRLRPVRNQSSPVEVGIMFYVFTINELNELSGKFSFTGFFTMQWKDEMMSWNETEYGGIDSLVVEPSAVWYPHIVFSNPFQNRVTLFNDWNPVRYSSSGAAVLNAGGLVSIKCEVELMFYPWDRQSCITQVMMLGYRDNEVKLRKAGNYSSTVGYSPNGEWSLADAHVSDASMKGASFLLMQFHLQRKPEFIIWNVIFPVVCMSFLNIMVFVLPAESGERVSYAMTVLLATAVFLTLVGDTLPKVSSPMPLLCFYLFSLLILGACVCVMTIINLAIYFKDPESQVPSCLKAFARCFQCRSKRQDSESNDPETNRPRNGMNKGTTKDTININLKQYPNMQNGTKYKASGSYNGKAIGSVLSDWKRHSATLGQQPVQINATKSCIKMKNEVNWKDVSKSLDIVCFILFCLALIALSAIFIISMSLNINSFE